jgi:tetratricopeptide (TPR) repeat protein
VKISERAYQLSQDLGSEPESIEALIGKAFIAFIRLDKSESYILDAERRLNSLADIFTLEMLKRRLLLIKSLILYLKGNNNEAAESARECLKLTKEQKIGKKLEENIGRKIDIAYTIQTIALLTLNMGKYNVGLNYAIKSLALQEELNNRVGIAASLCIVGVAYSFKGYLNQAIEYFNKCLVLKEIPKLSKFHALHNLGDAYLTKGELDQALKYLFKAVEFGEKNENSSLGLPLVAIGEIYEMKDNDSKAIKYYQRSLTVSIKNNHNLAIGLSLGKLVSVNINNNSRTQAKIYLERLKEFADQIEGKKFSNFYLNAKAYFLKMSGRTRDRAEAEVIWRQVVNDRMSHPTPYIEALSGLCEFLIEELEMSNDSEILNELDPLIIRWQNIAEIAHSYLLLALMKLFQAKVALISMKIEEGKKLMVEAQRIAELHGLTKLAQKISYEHDTLLYQIKKWEALKSGDAPISEKVKLASTMGVLKRIQGRHALETPELVDEEPILLLIMSNSGVTYFSHLFISNWDYTDLFSSFMSAFNTFSDEIFSKSIDRIRIGENTILINPVGFFLTCYVIKGQSYPALQKLTRFTEAIKANSEIWQALNKSFKTSEMLELDKPPALKTVIDEIFTQ